MASNCSDFGEVISGDPRLIRDALLLPHHILKVTGCASRSEFGLG